MRSETAILLTNTGTPNAPNRIAVARYLAEFLTDSRVIKLPKYLWYPLLYGFILPIRSGASAKLYRNIWTQNGSPLGIHMKAIAKKLSTALNLPVAVGMNYGTPSIKQALQQLTEKTEKSEKNIRNLIVLPLYPQYSGTSTAASFDQMTSYFKQHEKIPTIHFIHDYADHPHYIDAICSQIQTTWRRSDKKFLLFSYHGIPKRYAALGDPYPDRCRLTTEKVAEALGLQSHEYALTFQSRLGPTEWLTPYTDQYLQTLPKEKGITDIQVICPGFSVDCLETLEEIALRGREQFIASGGTSFEYIPALNDSVRQISLLSQIVAHLFE